MSGIVRWPVTARAVLFCSRCPARWESQVYDAHPIGSDAAAARPAFDLGWRVYVGSRRQHTYCPAHEPSTPMRLVLPKETDHA